MMDWWIFLLIILIPLGRFLWKAYTHPSHTLARQAANMGWVASGKIKDENGFNNVCVSRDGMTAVISYKEGNVSLIDPVWAEPFKDFVEVEHWATDSNSEGENDPEIEYYQNIESYIQEHDFGEKLLELQGSDEEYCISSMEVYKSGFRKKQSYKVIGALVMESIVKYEGNRELSILHLKHLKNDIDTKQG